jgi:hypothetical protein
MPDGTGDARRAIDWCLEAEPAAGDLLPEGCLECTPGTAFGLEGEDDPSPDIVPYPVRR